MHIFAFFKILFDFTAVICYTNCNFTAQQNKDYNGSKLLSEGTENRRLVRAGAEERQQSHS